MSKQIDERVVSMQFDNALFEKNIQKSLKSVDDLNKSLNNLDGAKGLDELSKAAEKVDLNPIIASAKGAEKSFSAMEIAGYTAISRLTNSLIDFGAKLGKNFWNATIGQIKSGGWKRASDIKAGEFMLEGLGFTGKRMKEISEAASNAVSGTAAGLGEAMKSAGTLAASGLTDAKKMEETLKGIAGVSAMTGRSFENIAQIYSTVASNGKLMTMQLRQFSFAGINVAAELAKQMNTTEAAINDMVTKGKIDFETFSEAMTKAFGDHAKDANKTFTGALANMKAALSRIGEKFATPFMDNMRIVFNTLRQTFNAVNKAMSPIYDDFSKLMKLGRGLITNVFGKLYSEDEKGNLDNYSKALDNIVASIRNLYSIIIMVFGTIGQAFKEIFPPIEDSSETFKELTDSLIPTADGLRVLKVAFKIIFAIIKQVSDAFKVLISVGSNALKIIFTIINKIFAVFGGIDNATKGFFDKVKKVNIFEKAIDGLYLSLTALGAVIIGIVSLVGKMFNKIKEFISMDNIQNIGRYIIDGLTNGIMSGLNALKNVWNGIVSFLPETVEKKLKIASPSRVMKAIGAFIIAGLVLGIVSGKGSLKEVVEWITNTFTSLFTLFGNLASIIGSTISIGINKVIGFVKKLSNKLEDIKLNKVNDKLKETSENLKEISDSETAKNISKDIDTIEDKFDEFGDDVNETVDQNKGIISSMFDLLSEKLTKFGLDVDGAKIVLIGFGAALTASLTQSALKLDLLSSLGRLIATISILVGGFMLLRNVDFKPFIDNLKALYNAVKTYIGGLDISKKIEESTNSIANVLQKNNLIILASKTLVFSFAIVMIRALHNISNLIMALSTTVRKFAGLTNINFKMYETVCDKMLKLAIALAVVVTSFSLLGNAFKENDTGMKAARDTILGLIAMMALFSTLILIISGNAKATISATASMKSVEHAALSMLLIVGALITVAAAMDNMDSDKLTWAFITFGAVLVSFAAFIKTLDKTKMEGVTVGTIIGFTVMFAAIAYMMKTMISMFMGDIGWKGTAKRLAAAIGPMIAALGMLTLLLKVIKDVDNYYEKTENSVDRNKKGKKGVVGTLKETLGIKERETSKFGKETAKTIAAMSMLMLSLAGFVKIMSTIKPDEIWSALAGMGIAILGFASVAVIIKHYGKSLDSISKFLAGFGVAIAACAGIVILLGKFNDIDFADALSKMAWIGTILIGLVTVLSFALSVVLDKFLNIDMTIKGLGMTLASISVGLAVLSTVFALMPQDRLDQFMKWTWVLVTIISGMIILLQGIRLLAKSKGKEDTEQAKETLLSLVGLFGAIAALMMSIIVLTFIDPMDMLAPVAAMSMITLMLMGILKQFEHMKNVGNVKAVFISLAVIVGLMSAALIALSLIPTGNEEQNLRTLTAAGSIFLAIYSLAYVIKSLEGLKIGKTAIGSLVMIAVIIAEVGIILAGLSMLTLNEDGGFAVLQSALAIMFVLVSLIGVIAIINGLKIEDQTIKSLYALMGVIGILGIILALLSNFGGDQLLQAGGAIAIVTGVMLGFIALCGIIGTKLPGVTLVLEAFAGVLVGLSALVATVGLAITLVMSVVTICLTQLENVDMDKIATGLMQVSIAMFQFGTSVMMAGVQTALGIAAIAGSLLLMLPVITKIGSLLMLGLALGISKFKKTPEKEAAKMTSEMVGVVEKGFGIASPSKVFKRIGGFLMKGLDSGIIAGIPIVGETLKGFVENIVEFLDGVTKHLEETGDTWGNAISYGVKEGLNMDLDLGENPLTDFMDNLTSGFEDAIPSMDDAEDALSGFGDQAAKTSTDVDGLNSSMANSIDMFEQFNDSANMSSRDVLPAFMSQLEGVSKWQSELESLSARGLGEVIVQELANMGPQAYEKVHAIYKMTNAELSMMNLMYKQKLSLQNKTEKGIKNSFKKLPGDITDTLEEEFDQTGNALVDQMDDLGSRMMKALKKQIDYQKVIDQVTGFRDNVADKIRSSMSIFEAVNEQEKESVEDLLSNMKAQVKHVGRWATMITELAAKGYDEGLVAMLTDMGPESYSKVEAFLSANEAQIAEANRLYKASEEVPNYGADKIVKAFAQAGYEASMGLTDSFLEGLDPEAVEMALQDLGQTSITTLLDTYDNMPYDFGDIGESCGVMWAESLVAAVEEGTKGLGNKVAENLKPTEEAKPLDYLDKDSVPKEVYEGMLKAQGSKEIQEKRKENELSRTDKLIREAEWNRNADKRKKDFKIKQDVSSDMLDKALSKAGVLNYVKSTDSTGVEYDFSDQVSLKTVMDKLRMQSVQGDQDAKKYLDFLDSLIDEAQPFLSEANDYYYNAGLNNSSALANGSNSKESLKKIQEANEEVAETALSAVAGYGGMPSNVPIMRNHADALKDTPLAKGFGMISDASMQVFADSAVEKGEELIPEAIGHLHDLTLESLTLALSDILDRLSGEEDDVTLGIRPVIDFLDDPIGSIKDMFDRNPVDLSASMKIDTSRKDSTKNNQLDILSRLNQMIDQQATTNTQLNQIYNKDSNVYMNSGALVGQIGHDVDRYLGVQANYARRGLA